MQNIILGFVVGGAMAAVVMLLAASRLRRAGRSRLEKGGASSADNGLAWMFWDQGPVFGGESHGHSSAASDGGGSTVDAGGPSVDCGGGFDGGGCGCDGGSAGGH